MQESMDSENPMVPTSSDDAASIPDGVEATSMSNGRSASAEVGAVQSDDSSLEVDVSDEDETAGLDRSDVGMNDADLSNEGVEDIADPFDEVDAEDEVSPIEETSVDGDGEDLRRWYILKVQSNREKSICEALARRVKIEGLDRFFGEIMVPTEDVAEYKNGKRQVVKRKLYPGYVVANMVLNEETWFLVRETPGIGDFTGAAGKPTPMLPEEVDRTVKSASPDEEDGETIKTAIPFETGDRVRIKDGTFGNFEGDVDSLDEANGRITVMINIFGRSTPVELEHWQVEAI